MLLVSAATLQPLPIPKQICIGCNRASLFSQCNRLSARLPKKDDLHQGVVGNQIPPTLLGKGGEGGLSKVDALNYGPGSMVQRALLFYCETAASVSMWHRVCFQFLPLRVALNTGAIQRSGRKGKP
jgi:hypothetical protein